MSDTHSISDSAVYRVAILVPGSLLVLLERNGTEHSLPRVRVSRWARSAREIQRAIWIRWMLSVVIIDYIFGSLENPLCIAESLSPKPSTLIRAPLGRVGERDLTKSERHIILEINAGDMGARGPFSRVGWHPEAFAWIEKEAKHADRFTGEIEQHNAGGTFALVRFPLCDGNSYWLKAVGEPNLHEYRITGALAEVCPKYLPQVVAARSDWHAWVMRDGGSPLDPDARAASFVLAVKTMAGLQITASRHAQELLVAGVADHRAEKSAGQIESLIHYLEKAMENQISTRVPRIDSRRLREIQGLLVDACAVMATLRIPDTVIHNDLNRGNILIRNDQCVFIDWCETGIGCPFLTFEHLTSLIPVTFQRAEALRGKLKCLYRRQWARQLSGLNVDRAFALTPPLAIASRLHGRGDWLKSERREDPGIQAYARTVARRLDRAVHTPEFLEALCR
ncbi:MAG: phosphotransferase [Silvibacterium sp.]